MKVGDKVKVVESDYYSDNLQPGNTGVIMKWHGSNDMETGIWSVRMDEGEPDGGEGIGWAFEPYRLEVIEPS